MENNAPYEWVICGSIEPIAEHASMMIILKAETLPKPGGITGKLGSWKLERSTFDNGKSTTNFLDVASTSGAKTKAPNPMCYEFEEKLGRPWAQTI